MLILLLRILITFLSLISLIPLSILFLIGLNPFQLFHLLFGLLLSTLLLTLLLNLIPVLFLLMFFNLLKTGILLIGRLDVILILFDLNLSIILLFLDMTVLDSSRFIKSLQYLSQLLLLGVSQLVVLKILI